MEMDKLDIIIPVCEKAFLAEDTRKKNLDDKADKFISAVAVVMGFQLLDPSHLTLVGIMHAAIYSWLAVCSLLTLGISLLLSLLSRRIQSYYTYADSKEFEQLIHGKKYNENDVKMEIFNMYCNARDNSAKCNDGRATLLVFSGYLLLIGFILAVASYVFNKTFTYSQVIGI
jgi:hypothetical protein